MKNRDLVPGECQYSYLGVLVMTAFPLKGLKNFMMDSPKKVTELAEVRPL